ncbi:MAG: hypothetical protein IPM29_08150 [Planctomycetes bacterium]|nr:hypothetical protein [Planctomycetota bacterium]
MATDLAAGRILLFGGAVGTTYLSDSWLLDGVTWSRGPASGPAARARHAMAADLGRGAVVLFGGIDGVGINNWFGDTWEYVNGAWTQRASTNHPLVRFGHAMAYDGTRGRVVMFGGRTRSGPVFLNDTWEWDGINWTPFTPAHSPSARMGHAMAFDPVSGRVLLFGGLPLGGPVADDTWEWDGVDWSRLAPAHAPTARMQATIATDLARSRIVLYGGYDGTDLVDTAEWDGSDWRILAVPVHPALPVLPAMATGPGGRHVVLFGGEDTSSIARAETWWNGTFAAVSQYGAGCGSPPLALGVAAGSSPVLGQSFRTELRPVPPGGTPFQWVGGSDRSWLGRSLPFDLTPLGATGCALLQDAVVAVPCSLAGQTATLALAIPRQPAFAGVRLYLQGFALAAGGNPAGVLTSDALALDLGY